MKLHKTTIAIAGLIASVLGQQAHADVITDWNLYGVQTTKGSVSPLSGVANPFTGSALNTNLASRIQAIQSIAVYNAVNSILQFGTSYGSYSTPAAPGASPEAAAAQAARDVLVNYFPSQQTTLDSLLATSLTAIPDGQAKSDGIAAGSAAAAHIIALRANDGSSPNATYPGPASPAVGVYQLTPNIPGGTAPYTFGAGINWLSVRNADGSREVTHPPALL